MPPLPRGTCPFCGATVALRKGELVREHKTPGGINVRGLCPGSGRPTGYQIVKVRPPASVGGAPSEAEVRERQPNPIEGRPERVKVVYLHSRTGAWVSGDRIIWP